MSDSPAGTGAGARLLFVATPIGNLDDLGARAAEALRGADAVACEDTRRTRVLLARYGIPRPRMLLSYREQTETRAGEQILSLVAGGMTVAVCSDGGFPGISDPGYRLARLAVERGVEFRVIPGACAVPAALLNSGLPTSSFTFKGYPPRKPGALRRFFEEEKDLPHTLVLFESPFRVAATLEAAQETLGDREAAVCAEMTKLHERTLRGYLGDLRARIGTGPMRGEVTIVIAGAAPKFRRAAAPPAACPTRTGAAAG